MKIIIIKKYLLWMNILHFKRICYQCLSIYFPLLSDNGGSQRAMADTALKYKAAFGISYYHITVYP